MRLAIVTLAAVMLPLVASAQQYASYSGYKVCPTAQTEQGKRVVSAACGGLDRPVLKSVVLKSLSDLEAARAKRDGFVSSVDTYGVCVSSFIDSFRRPGAPADSQEPDQAACAHAWAEDQATEVVREYGRACIDYSNRSIADRSMPDFTGDCYPTVTGGRG